MKIEITPALKQRWIEALESGKYAYGATRLRGLDNNTFCVVGVLADLIDPSGWDDSLNSDLGQDWHCGAMYNQGTDIKERLWALMRFNDDCKDETFSMQIKYIKENL